MTNAHYFDEDPVVEGEADAVVQEMARRQFGVSLAVGFVLLAVAGLTVMRAGHDVVPVQTVQQHHRIIQVQPAQTEVAEPAPVAPTKG
jgi:hypothetical protein